MNKLLLCTSLLTLAYSLPTKATTFNNETKEDVILTFEFTDSKEQETSMFIGTLDPKKPFILTPDQLGEDIYYLAVRQKDVSWTFPLTGRIGVQDKNDSANSSVCTTFTLSLKNNVAERNKIKNEIGGETYIARLSSPKTIECVSVKK